MWAMGVTFKTLCLWILLWVWAVQSSAARAESGLTVPILAYHRFGPVSSDRMMVRSSRFESHLRYLHDGGFTVISLQQCLDYLASRSEHLPPRPVVITVDDGHNSVYEYMRPIVERYRVPVTLFIYPSAISNASYALTWEQLAGLEQTGWFNVESHTYWHPNFKIEKRRLSNDAYLKFVDDQLMRSRQVLEQKTGHQVVLLAWPFGLFDDELLQRATAAGYVAAFTLEPRAASRNDRLLALPRLLMIDAYDEKRFGRLLSRAMGEK